MFVPTRTENESQILKLSSALYGFYRLASRAISEAEKHWGATTISGASVSLNGSVIILLFVDDLVLLAGSNDRDWPKWKESIRPEWDSSRESNL